MHLDSEPMRAETRADFARTQSLGVSGFPTLGLAHGQQLYLVTSGYVTDDVLEYRIAEIERLVDRKAAAG
jgi:protein-disulfide isomerase-like protein with CxxC motif